MEISEPHRARVPLQSTKDASNLVLWGVKEANVQICKAKGNTTC